MSLIGDLLAVLWLVSLYAYIGILVLLLVVLVGIIATVQFVYGFKRKHTVQ